MTDRSIQGDFGVDGDFASGLKNFNCYREATLLQDRDGKKLIRRCYPITVKYRLLTRFERIFNSVMRLS